MLPRQPAMSSFFGILLALLCALTTNVGFLYKHRGACAAPSVDIRRPLRSAKALFASPLFTIGWMIGAGAWVFHVAAMSVAPLSLVQAVLAGGMVMLAIMAEQMLGCSIGRRQWIGLGADRARADASRFHASRRPRRRLAVLDSRA